MYSLLSNLEKGIPMNIEVVIFTKPVPPLYTSFFFYYIFFLMTSEMSLSWYRIHDKPKVVKNKMKNQPKSYTYSFIWKSVPHNISKQGSLCTIKMILKVTGMLVKLFFTGS